MSKTIKLGDEDYLELSRVKRGLEHERNCDVTLGEAVGILLRAYVGLLLLAKQPGLEHPLHENPDDSS